MISDFGKAYDPGNVLGPYFGPSGPMDPGKSTQHTVRCKSQAILYEYTMRASYIYV